MSDEYRGDTYFSATLPKGADDGSRFNPVMYDLVESYLKNPKDSSMDQLQSLFLDIGYLDRSNPLSDDGNDGPMTKGAALRYESNYADNATRHTIKQIPSNIIDSVVDYFK